MKNVINLRNLLLILLMYAGLCHAEGEKERVLREYIDTTMNKVMLLLGDKNAPLSDKTKEAKDMLRKNMDSVAISRFTLGRNVLQLKEDQVKHFTEVFSEYLINTCSQTIRKYNGQKIVITNISTIADNEYMVKTEITKEDASVPISVWYVVRDKGSSCYKIIDIITEGVSLVTTYRESFADVINTRGIDTLIDEINSKSPQIQP